MVIIVDVQNDFCEGGKLAVNGGHQVSKNIQDWLTFNLEKNEEVLLTQDWHPIGHCSFGEWPEHCVQHTAGAAFDESLIQYLGYNSIDFKIQKKGWNPVKDMYSFLDDDELKREYKESFDDADRIVVTGIVGTVCVMNTLKDLVDMGYRDKIIVPIKCVAHFNNEAKQELIDWLTENNITIGYSISPEASRLLGE